MRGRTFRVRVLALGWIWTVASLSLGEGTRGAAKPQEPEAQSSAQPAQSQKEKKDEEKKKKETPEDPNNSDQDWTSVSQQGFKGLGKAFLEDQKQLWTSPVRLRFVDADWLVPMAGFTAGLFVTDSDYSRHLSNNPQTLSSAKTRSDAGVAALIGGAAAMYLLSYPSHREHWRETGFLAGEAAINSLVAVEALKYTTQRERPYQGDGTGPFFSGGTSFPSEHAAAAWAVAGVIAHEYPGPIPKILAYGLASFVSYERIRGKQHFPSDVFVGSTMGQMISQDIYSRRHDPELGGGEWQSLTALARAWESSGPQNLGTPYVPLDSWIYDALERLAGLGLIDSAFAGMRPWTRRECMRQLIEAEEKVDAGENSEAGKLIAVLEHEFRPETEALGDGTDGAAFRLESLYSRTEHISGAPLTDGYAFGQTQYNDFGRPYGEGWSTVNGFSAYATKGPWVLYVRGEAQTAPSIPALGLPARESAASRNFLPLQPATPQPAVEQLALLDTYVGLMLSNWEISFGRQSLWWGTGPTEGTSLDMSNNAQPIDMFRISRTTPLKLPRFLGWLGPMRTEFFLGRLAGYEFIRSPLGLVGQFGQALSDQPFINGQNISFKPTRNFEFGFYRVTLFSGEGYPFTTHALIASLFDTGNAPFGAPDKPGKRTSALDFSYRLPRLRNWVTFYGDGYTNDEFSPIAYPSWSAWHSGLFFSHFPTLPKLDLRVEGVYTDVPHRGGSNAPGAFYFDATWANGYTNNGNIIGSWVGRGGQGAQAWTNYWFSSRSRLQLNFRHQKVSQEYIGGGGTVTDFGVRGDYWWRSNISFSASVQYERWLFPVIQGNAEKPVSATIEIQFQPQKLFQHSVQNQAGDALWSQGQP
jgi:hypothetical protein